MSMWTKIGRLFVIKTRFEAWLVIYAIALGAVERGGHYLETYPGMTGWILAAACTGVVFLAGAKLLDSVRKPESKSVVLAHARPVAPPTGRRPMARRNRPTARRTRRSEGLFEKRRRD